MANGSILQCTHELLNCPINIQGHYFIVNLKILPLMYYDIILGMAGLNGLVPWKCTGRTSCSLLIIRVTRFSSLGYNQTSNSVLSSRLLRSFSYKLLISCGAYLRFFNWSLNISQAVGLLSYTTSLSNISTYLRNRQGYLLKDTSIILFL